MNDEIKEMLHCIEMNCKHNKCFGGVKLDEKDCKLLLDYITNLQQIEKEHQNCTRKHRQQKCFEHSVNEKIYKSRIKKIRNYVNSTDFIYDEQYKKKDKIENILKGSDENGTK